MSDGYQDYSTPRARKCKICGITERNNKVALMQYGDFTFLCQICNPHKSERDWTLSKAWRVRYEQKRPKCYYCNSPNTLTDCNGDSHPNPFHYYQGKVECEYCQYDREVVTPRHEASVRTYWEFVRWKKEQDAKQK